MPLRPRILLTGKDGQLGCELQPALARIGDVIATDRTTLDLENASDIQRVVAEINPALIVNAAAYTAVDRAESEPERAHAINATAPGVFANSARECGAAVLHFSTDYVFDGSANSPYAPDAPTNPINTYGRTKREGELAIIATGVPSVIVRTSWVYALAGRNFVRAILAQLEQGKPLRVVSDQLGSPTWAHDLAAGAAAIAEQMLESPGKHTGIYHLTGAGVTNWHEFASAIVEFAGPPPRPIVMPVPSTEFPTKARRPMYSALDCSTTERDFGVKLPHWRDALQRAMRTLRQYGDSKAPW